MSTTPGNSLRDELSPRYTETAIELGILVILAVWCFHILRPFIVPSMWVIIIALAIFPLYRRLVDVLGGRRPPWSRTASSCCCWCPVRCSPSCWSRT